MVKHTYQSKKVFERSGTYLVVTAAVCVFVLLAVDPALAQVVGGGGGGGGGGGSGGNYNDAQFGAICGRAVDYIQGGFGQLLACVAGVGAIVASAAGGFRMAWACLVVSVGCFILRNYLDLFFQGLCQ